MAAPKVLPLCQKDRYFTFKICPKKLHELATGTVIMPVGPTYSTTYSIVPLKNGTTTCTWTPYPPQVLSGTSLLARSPWKSLGPLSCSDVQEDQDRLL